MTRPRRSLPPPARRFGLVCAGLLLAVLGGCGELDAPGDPLSIFTSTLEPAYLGEPYEFNIIVSGGLAPYNFELDDGELPPGLTLENGSVSGTPAEAGTFEFSVQVSDASLSQNAQDFTLSVTTAPPAVLVLNVPPTTVTDAVRIPINVTDARDLRSLRTQITWDETLFTFVGGSVRSSQGSLGVLQRAREGQLSVDLSFLGPTLTGDGELFSFELRPTEPNTLTLSARTEFRTGAGEHGFSSTEDSAALPEVGNDSTVDPTDPDGTIDPDLDDNSGEETDLENPDATP